MERGSVGPGEVNIEGLDCGADAADDFAGPEFGAEEGDPAVFWFADGAEKVSLVGGLVGVYAAFGEVAFERAVGGFGGSAGADAESLALEALEELEQLTLTRPRQN